MSSLLENHSAEVQNTSGQECLKRQDVTSIEVVSSVSKRRITAATLCLSGRVGVGAVAGEIKRVDTQIGGPLGLLLAVMHQSISRPLYYSDCAHYSDEGLRCSGTSG